MLFCRKTYVLDISYNRLADAILTITQHVWFIECFGYLLQSPCREHGLYWVQSGVLPKKFGHKLFLSLSAQLDNVLMS